MNKFLKIRNILIFFVFAILILAPFSQFVIPAKAETLQEQFDRLQKEIDEINKQKDTLQSQLDANSYTISGYNSQLSNYLGQAKLLQQNIDQLKLEINQLEVSINILNSQIETQKKEIERSEATILDLDKESNLRIRNSYMNYKMYGNISGGSTLLVIDDINSYFKDSQYKEIIQSSTNELMLKVAQLKQELSDKKEELNKQLNRIKKDKELIDIKKSDLDKQKETVDLKIAEYYSQVNSLQSKNNQVSQQIQVVNQEAVEKEAQANKIQQEILNSYVPADDGQYVVAGTYMGKQGCTGLCTGPHLHFMVYDNGELKDPCAYLAGGVCGYGDGSRVKWPLNPVTYYTSPYGPRCIDGWGCDFHNGIDIVGSSWNAPIFSAHNGYIHKHWDDGYGAHYIILCENVSCTGLKTGYWHLSEF